MVADELSDVSALFNRKMEFHPARKQFNGFSNGGGNFRPQTLNPSSSNTQTHKHSPKNLKKADGSWVFENGMDPEISAIKFKRIGAGLQNLGNTCFLNSVLQCLTYTEPLAAYLQSGKHQSSCRTAGFCALCAIQKHVSRALQSTGRILAPKEIVSNLRCISRSFRNSRQEDAHEYMVNLLESMHKCCLPSGVPSESPSAYDKSLVHKIFGGRLRSQVKCMQCSYSSNNYDPFLDLSLEIAKAESLNKALSHFTAKEQLDGGERQYQCQQCKQKVRAFKRLTIDKAPYVLTIHLKRFGSHFAGQKIDKKVLFGPTLDLEPFVTDPYDGDLKYTLYGVLVHAGWSTHSGHYYCFVRTSSGNWYSLDDNRVVQVSERKVLEQKAYMLFYYRNRRNFAPKKPLDVVQKQNMTTNAMGSIKAYSNLNQGLKETIQSGRTVQTRLNCAVCAEDSLNAGVSAETLIKDSPGQNLNVSTTTESSAPNKDPLSESSPRVPPLEDPMKGLSVTSSQDGECLPQQDSSSVGVSEETLIKDSPGQNLSGLMTAECSTPNKDTPLEPSPQAPPLEDPMKGLSVKSHKDGECSPQQDSFVAGSNVPLKLDSAMVTTSDAKLLECGPDRGAKEEVIDSGAISSNENEYKIPENSLDESIAISPNGCIPQETPEVTKMTEKASPEESCCEASLLDAIGKTMEKIPPIILLSSASRENSQGEAEAISAKLSTLPSAKHMLIKKNVLEGKHSQRMRKKNHSQRMRKKHPKCPIIKLHLSSKILLGTTLGVQKKKLKRSKKSTFGTTKTNLVQKHLVDGVHADSIPSNPGPYTSDDPLQKSSNSGSAGSQRDASRPINSRDGKRDSMINSLMSMLTRGLEETIVPRWDDIQSTSCQTTEPRRVDIGYVGDEWDEEYDRGKKRKVRRNMKNDFSGPNLFQEFVNTNPKLKKARMGLSSSGNKPYRI